MHAKTSLRACCVHARNRTRNLPSPDMDTNDLVSDRAPDLIAKSIVDVASSIKNENHYVAVSNIITQADHLKEKANEVNDYLSKLCIKRSIYLIDHSKSLKTQHVNGSKLHLNRRGCPILQNTVCKFLSKIFN